eukprot:2213832-Amphidinium_carterae.1
MGGAALQMPAMSWTDKKLLEGNPDCSSYPQSLSLHLSSTYLFACSVYGGAKIGTVETQGAVVLLKASATLELNPSVAASHKLPWMRGICEEMQGDVHLPPSISCGEYLDYLGTHRIWMARGGSRLCFSNSFRTPAFSPA